MNDEKKELKPALLGSDPDPSAGADDNPWDDDGGGRTLATDGPTFELPSNIPSPITVPPPAMVLPAAAVAPAFPMKRSPVATLVGLTPEDFPFANVTPGPPRAHSSPAPAAGAPPGPVAASPPALVPPRPAGGTPQRPAGGPPSSSRMPLPPPLSARLAASIKRGSVSDAPPLVAAPPPPVGPAPVVLPGDDLPGNDGEFGPEDGPTMAVASPPLGRPLRDDMVNPRSAAQAAIHPAPRPNAGYVPPVSRMIDRDAETMAIGGDDPRLPLLRVEGEETTRAISREEMMRHQDAHVIIGAGAMGDDATLAIAPRHFADLPPAPGGGFPGPPPNHDVAVPQHGMHGGPPMHPQHPPQPQSWQAEPPSYRNLPQGPQPQGYDPMYPQQPPFDPQRMQGQFPQSGQQPTMQGPSQSNPMGWGPPPNAPTMQQQQGMMQVPMAGHASPWMMQASAPKAAPTIGGVRLTPQLLLLAGVGVVCLAIFVIGIVLFVTTKF